MSLLDPSDGGFISRKFLLTAYSLHLFLGLGILALNVPAFAPLVDTVGGLMLGSLALYFTGNIGNKVAVAKAAKQPVPVDKE